MSIDITSFQKYNVIDTCSIWNILSSRVLYAASAAGGCMFCCTQFVLYECVYKPRKIIKPHEIELKKRLSIEQSKGKLMCYPINIDDLIEVEYLVKTKNLSKGELSSMVFAKKTRQAFLTDDQGARKLATEYIGDITMIQTTPQLFGWLFYNGNLSDADKDPIIGEHNSFDGPLERYFNETYRWALELRLAKYCSSTEYK